MPFPYHVNLVPWPTFHGNNARTGVYGEDPLVAAPEPHARPATRRVTLYPSVPNPFNPSTTLRFSVPGSSGQTVQAVLEVYDLVGRRVRTLVNGPVDTGEHTVRWNGRDATGRPVSSGIYFARLRAAQQVQTIKMTLVK